MTITTFKNEGNLLDSLKIFGIIITVIVTITFFIYQAKGLPPRIDKLEKDVPLMREELKSEINSLKSQIDKNSSKTDIILDDVKAIKTILMTEKRNK